MRKYTLADGSKRGVVDLIDFTDVITAAVKEFAPGTTVTDTDIVKYSLEYWAPESFTDDEVVDSWLP